MRIGHPCLPTIGRWNRTSATAVSSYRERKAGSRDFLQRGVREERRSRLIRGEVAKS
jgi:hypothetical protein